MTQNPGQRTPWIIVALLLAATLVTFWPVTQCDFINFDDPDYVTKNAMVMNGLTWEGVRLAFTTSHASNWHPLTWLSHMVDVSLFGLNPAGHHAINLVLHALNAVLVFLLFLQMTGARWRSALVAALFALHPLRVESVAWVSERKDVLCAFFGLLALIAYARYVSESKIQGQKFKTWYSAALIGFTLGLMCKPMLVTWPFVMLLLDVWPLQRVSLSTDRVGSHWKKLVLEKLPFFVLSLASCIVTRIVQEQAVVRANLSWLARVFNAAGSYLSYLEDFFWPTKLAVFYPHPATTQPNGGNWIGWYIGLAILLVLAMTILAIKWAAKKPWATVGWLWYVGTLVPVIGLLQVGEQARADRYTYLPMIGFTVALVWTLADAGRGRQWRPNSILIPVAAVLGLLAWLSREQCRRWQNSVTLFSHTLAVTQNNATAHYNLGQAYESRGLLPEAVAQYEACIRIDPRRPDDYHSLAHALVQLGDSVRAEAAYRRALELKPNYPLAHYNLAILLHKAGRLDEAKRGYDEAIRGKPDYAAAHSNLGRLLFEQGNYSQAETHYREALRLEPLLAQAEAGLGLSLAIQGRTIEALPFLTRAVEQQPNDVEARIRLGNVLLDANQPELARQQYAAALNLKSDLVEQNLEAAAALVARGETDAALARYLLATRLAPDNATAHEQLGMVLAQRGKSAEALAQFQEVLRLRPDATANYHLGLLLVAMGRHREAMPYYRRALELKPDLATALNDVAWILATHPQAELRNGEEAIQLAERACALGGEKEPRYWGTLDAAYAEAGRFAEAITTAEKTRALAKAASQIEILKAADERLVLYRANKPYRLPQ